MSLKVWLPLTGNLENKGLSEGINFTQSSLTYSDGKIGQCAYFNNIKTNTVTIPNFNGTKQFSIALWIKLPSSVSSTAWADVISFTASNGSTTAPFRLEHVNNTLNWYCNGVLTDSGGIGSYTTVNVTNNDIWHHLTVTKDSANFYLYLDGNLYITKVIDSSYINSYLTGPMTIGDNTGSYFYANDIRVYNHCLSAKEVKEISQGLVLHYKLDGGLGGVGKNLTPCGSLYTKESPWTTSKANTDGYAFVTNSAFEGKPSTTYTISVECDGTLSSSHSAGGIPISDKPWAFWAYICNVDTTKAWTSGGYDRPVVLTNSNNNYRKIGNRHAWTITLSSTEKYISLRTNSYSDGSTPVTINWWNIKVEEGTNRTPWVDSLIDSNYDDTKVIDSSGYNHVGSLMGNPTTFSESSRYLVSTNFDGIDDGVLIENLNLSPVINNNITYSFWIKPWGENGARSIYFGSYSSTSWSIEKTTGNLLRLYWNGSPDETCTGLSITDGVWQHIAVVKSGTNDVKAYLNGVQKWSSSAAHNTLTFPTTYRLARDTRSNDNTPYKGQMADFRIYATALSAEDILDLYHTSANIDNLGDIHSFEFDEVETTNLSDFSLTSSNWVSDGVTATYTTEHNIGDIVKMVPSSGNKRIYHNVSNVWTSGKVYLVSLWAKADSSGAVIRPSRSIADWATPNFNLTTEWKQYYGIINCTTTATGGTLSISYSGSTNIPCYISHIKLEEANKNLVSILKNGLMKENWIDEVNFTTNAKILKSESVTVGREFIEK